MSFTRSATWNLWRRVERIWGPAAVVWPHRIVTLDTVMCDLLHDLLRCGMVHWPHGHQTLDVHDSWAAFSGSVWTRADYQVKLQGSNLQLLRVFTRSQAARVEPNVILPLLANGVCTHGDVRDVLTQALEQPAVVERLTNRLAVTTRSLIVDEVFDANELDLQVIELAISAGIAVTLVGDPWQALYLFRGARPEKVHDLLGRARVQTMPLTRSFRWRTREQEELANRLRAGESVTLSSDGDWHERSDVVLGLFWKPLWDVGPEVLPIAFQSFKGGVEEAAATLLLNHVTRNIFNEDATYLREALTALAITDLELPRQLEDDLQAVVDLLRTPGREALVRSYEALTRAMGRISPRQMRPAHHAHTERLADLSKRLRRPGRPVPGLTAHQAKGREWEIVSVRLAPSEQAALEAGLSVEDDTHRKLYVACTRARQETIAV